MKKLLFVCLFGLVSIVIGQKGEAEIVACSIPEVSYSTYIGDTLTEYGASILADDVGNAYIAGTTFSFDFPTARTSQHGVDVVALKFSPDGNQLSNSIWLNPAGENDVDFGNAIGRDASGNIYIAGETSSPDLCATFGAVPGYDTTYNGGGDGFLIRTDADLNVTYCTFLGGVEVDRLMDIHVGSDGTTTITGGTFSPDFPITVGNVNSGQRDVFVTQFNPALTALNYSVTIGGASQEEARAVAVASDGSVYVTGWTFSTDFPVNQNAYQTVSGGGSNVDAFLTKILDGTVIFSSYIGGNDEDRAYDIALDASEFPYIVGITGSTDLLDNVPAFLPSLDRSFNDSYVGGRDAFIFALNHDGSAPVYGSYWGGSQLDQIKSIFSIGNQLFVAGVTQSADFPITPNALSRTLSGSQDLFVTRFDPNQSILLHSTYFGGSEIEGEMNSKRDIDIFVDRSGATYLTGQTRSDDFCTTNSAYDPTHNGDYDVFVTKMQIGEPISISGFDLFLPMVETP